MKFLALTLISLFAYPFTWAVNKTSNDDVYFPVGLKKTIYPTGQGNFSWSVYGRYIYEDTSNSSSCKITASTYGEADVYAYDQFGNICETWTATAFVLCIKDPDKLKELHDGETLKFELDALPSGTIDSIKSKLSNVDLKLQNDSGEDSGLSENPKKIKMNIVQDGSSSKWKSDNIRWYQMPDNQCAWTCEYRIVGEYNFSDITGKAKLTDINGSLQYEKMSVNFRQDVYDVATKTYKTYCNIIGWIEGDIGVTSRFDSAKNKWVLSTIGKNYRRAIRTDKKYGDVRQNSQYREMAVAEEDDHEKQYKTNGYSKVINKDNFLSTDRLFNETLDFARNHQADSEEDFIKEVNDKFMELYNSIYIEDMIFYKCDIESEAKSNVNSSHLARMRCAYPDC